MAKRARVASKTAFFEAAREWRAADVTAIAREAPKLVATRDDAGRTALHVCSRRQPKDVAERKPTPVPQRLIHGDQALDNVLIDVEGTLSLIDWADGGPGDPRHDIALALQTKPEIELTAAAVHAFFAGYGSAPLDDGTRDWFVRLYDYL